MDIAPLRRLLGSCSEMPLIWFVLHGDTAVLWASAGSGARETLSCGSGQELTARTIGRRTIWTRRVEANGLDVAPNRQTCCRYAERILSIQLLSPS